MILLQIMNSAAADTLAAEGSGDGSVQVIDLIFKGGFMMIPIALLSLVAV